MFKFQKIRHLCDEAQATNKSLRIQDIADGIRISKKMLEKYRDGVSQPTADVLERMAVYFGKDVNYFFDSQKSGDHLVDSVVKAPTEGYIPSRDNPYQILYELQKELTEIIKENSELKVENERLKNFSATNRNVKTG